MTPTLRFQWDGIIVHGGRFQDVRYTIGGLVPGLHPETVSVYPVGRWQPAVRIAFTELESGTQPIRVEPEQREYRSVRAAADERGHRLTERLKHAPKSKIERKNK